MTIGGYSGKDETNVEGRLGIMHHFKKGLRSSNSPLGFCLASEKDHLAAPQLKEPCFLFVKFDLYQELPGKFHCQGENVGEQWYCFVFFLKTCADFDPLSDMETFSRCSQECILCI